MQRTPEYLNEPTPSVDRQKLHATSQTALRVRTTLHGLLTNNAQWPFLLSIVAHLAAVLVANHLAFWLRFEGAVPHSAETAFRAGLPVLVVLRAAAFALFRVYGGLWRYTSLCDLRALIGGVAASSALFAAFILSPLGAGAAYPRAVLVNDALLLLLLLGGVRLAGRFAAEYSRPRPSRRVLVVGAGDAGELIVRDMRNNSAYQLDPVAFVDDDRRKIGRRIHGVPVLGTRAEIGAIAQRCRPDEVLVAIPSAQPATMRQIVRSLSALRLPIKTLPSLQHIVDCKVDVGQIRSVAFEDLLCRAPIGLDRRPLQQLIAGRRVMVTGAGGSIGSELCRQIAGLNPGSLVMYERYENSLHEVAMELRDRWQMVPVHVLVGDVSDSNRVQDVLEAFRPEIIFHAAAHKHVPLMEDSPCEAVKNNVRGTRVLVDAAERHGVERLILISTDKAVKPSSVMGATKRVAEMIVQCESHRSRTSLSTVRFGNVLGSNGSVLPRFIDQIRRGGPVTVTHPDMKRFFMLIEEAVQLVLHAAAQAETGATYVLEMGEQVRLVDMANDLIRLAGLTPGEDVRIEFVGLRPGEKLSEELSGPDETISRSAVDKVLCVRSTRPVPSDLLAQVERLEAAAVRGRAAEVRERLVRLVTPAGMTAGYAASAPIRRPIEPALPDVAPLVASLGTARRQTPAVSR